MLVHNDANSSTENVLHCQNPIIFSELMFGKSPKRRRVQPATTQSKLHHFFSKPVKKAECSLSQSSSQFLNGKINPSRRCELLKEENQVKSNGLLNKNLTSPFEKPKNLPQALNNTQELKRDSVLRDIGNSISSVDNRGNEKESGFFSDKNLQSKLAILSKPKTTNPKDTDHVNPDAAQMEQNCNFTSVPDSIVAQQSSLAHEESLNSNDVNTLPFSAIIGEAPPSKSICDENILKRNSAAGSSLIEEETLEEMNTNDVNTIPSSLVINKISSNRSLREEPTEELTEEEPTEEEPTEEEPTEEEPTEEEPTEEELTEEEPTEEEPTEEEPTEEEPTEEELTEEELTEEEPTEEEPTEEEPTEEEPTEEEPTEEEPTEEEPTEEEPTEEEPTEEELTEEEPTEEELTEEELTEEELTEEELTEEELTEEEPTEEELTEEEPTEEEPTEEELTEEELTEEEPTEEEPTEEELTEEELTEEELTEEEPTEELTEEELTEEEPTEEELTEEEMNTCDVMTLPSSFIVGGDSKPPEDKALFGDTKTSACSAQIKEGTASSYSKQSCEKAEPKEESGKVHDTQSYMDKVWAMFESDSDEEPNTEAITKAADKEKSGTKEVDNVNLSMARQESQLEELNTADVLSAEYSAVIGGGTSKSRQAETGRQGEVNCSDFSETVGEINSLTEEDSLTLDNFCGMRGPDSVFS